MAKVLQHRRGTTAQHAAFVGALGEITIDTDKKTIVVHDGTTAGGHPLARPSDISSAVGNYIPRAGSQGAVGGYTSTAYVGAIDANSWDTTVCNSNLTVQTGAPGTAWTKIVRIDNAIAITLGANWFWARGELPTIVSAGILVLCWCGYSGIAAFISPSA